MTPFQVLGLFALGFLVLESIVIEISCPVSLVRFLEGLM